MKIDEFWMFDHDEFSPELKEGCSIECPECKEFSHHNEWVEAEVGCEDCGSHAAMKCPKCDVYFDGVGFSVNYGQFITKIIKS